MRAIIRVLIINIITISIAFGNTTEYDTLIKKAQSQRKDSNYIEAKEIYLKAIKHSPNKAIAYYELADIYISVKDFDNSIKYLKSSLAKDPYYKSFLTNYLLGYALNNIAKYQEAIHYLNLAKKIEPKDSATYSALGYSYLALSEYKKALSEYNKMLSLQPDSAEANYLVALAHYLLKEYTSATNYLKRATKLHPAYAEAYMYLAICSGYLEKYSDVIIHAKESIKLSSDIANQIIKAEVTPLDIDRMESTGIKAGVAYASKDYVQAKELYKNMYRLYPDDRFLNSVLAQIEIDTLNYTSAIGYLKTSIENGATNSYTYYLLAKSLHHTDSSKEAKEYIQKAIQKEPTDANYHLLLAQIDEKLDNQEAIKSYEKASSLDTNIKEANLKVGIKLAQESRYQEALDMFARNLIKSPNDAMTNYYIGFCLVMLQKYDKSIKYLQDAINLQKDAKVFNYHYYLGYAYYETKSYKKAIKELEIAKEMAKDDSFVHYYLALSYAQTKEYEKMKESLIATIGLEPSNIHASYVLGSYYYKESLYQDALKYLKNIADNHAKEYPNSIDMIIDIYKSLKQNDKVQKYQKESNSLVDKNTPKKSNKPNEKKIIIIKKP
jgi:tetratricopeptide (TPR) repeat protein